MLKPRFFIISTFVLTSLFRPDLHQLQALPATPLVAEKIERSIDEIEAPMPLVKPLFEYHLRDVSICKGPDGGYYLTGTTDDNWGVAEGIRLWKSSDLENWELLGDGGYVWTFEKDGHPWQKEIAFNEQWKKNYRGIWAPEIHYFKNTFWIPYSASNVHDSGLLKSISGKPEGPKLDINTDGPLVDGIDATLIETAEGDIYYVWAHGRVRKLNHDMSGFEGEELPSLFAADGNKVGYEGVNLFYYEGKYHLIAAEWNTEGPHNGHKLRNTRMNRRAADGRYDCMIAVSDGLLGPYSDAYIAIPHGGHNAFFTDHEGQLWATMFGNDEAAAPFRENAAIVKMQYDKTTSTFSPVLEWKLSAPFEDNAQNIFVDASNALEESAQDGKSWASAYCSLQAAVDAAVNGSILHVREGQYDAFEIKGKQAIRMLGGYSKEQAELARNVSLCPTTIRPSELHARGVILKDAPFTRLDGFVFQGFQQTAPASTKIGGAALQIVGGGESIRILNSGFIGNQSAGHGGAVYIGEICAPLFINCEFLGNRSLRNGGAVAVEMEGNNGYHQRFYNCRFEENYAEMHGGVVWATTVHKQTGLVRFTNCLIRENRSLLEKGVITLEGGCNLLMSHCEVVENRGMANGAVVASFGRVPAQNRIVNSIFCGNVGGYLFEGDGFDPGPGHPWGPKGRAWTQLENNAFSKNEVGAILRRTFDAKQWLTVKALNQSLVGDKNMDLESKAPSELRAKGTPSSSFPLDLDGRKRDVDAPDVGLGSVHEFLAIIKAATK